MTRRAVLQFFSLWNQAVGALIARYRPDIFHCPDFHTAIAPWYAVPSHPSLRMLLVLHNAEYQGSISTDMITGSRLIEVASIFNLPVSLVAAHLVVEGRFNMLKAAVDFVVERQGGLGTCAVSRYYAEECHSTFSLLWKLPVIEGLDNPMLEEERPRPTTDLASKKASAKRQVQEKFGLALDPEARLFVSLGRLVRQKGVDILADITKWLLSTYPGAQLIVIGPPADGFGFYAAQKLTKLAESPEFSGRLFLHFEFMVVPEELKWAADFCLMPSRDEPFGYVDVEFAWHGAVLVGAQAGGLGKVPGFYYVAQNRENLGRLRRELRTAVSTAMAAPAAALRQMSQEAMRCSFPLKQWQQRLVSLYSDLLQGVGADTNATAGSSELISVDPSRNTFSPYQSRWPSPTENPEPPLGVQGNEFLKQELSEEELAERVKAKLSSNEALDIDAILQSIGADRDREQETCPVARWLLQPTLGTARIHWLVYVASPVSGFLTFVVVATEWGIRGSTDLPAWFKRFPWFKTVFGTGGLDPPIMNMLLFSVNALSGAIGAPIWALLARRVQPRRLLAAALLLQIPLLLTAIPIRQPTVSLAVALIFLQGLAGSGSLMFICFNFMMSIKADMSHAALRMGFLEMLRYCVTWLLTSYVFVASPSTVVGTAEAPLPAKVYWLLAPVADVALCTTLVPGVLCLFAPGPYREDRFPGWDFHLLGKRKVFLLLGLSDIIGALALFPGTCYVIWWLANGWTSESLAWISVIFAVAGAEPGSRGLSVTLLLAPASILRAVVQEEVSTFTFLGRSDVAVSICLVSLIAEGIRGSAIWAVKVRVLNSRWRLLSYGSLLLSCQSLAAMLSPFLCEWIARMHSGTFISANQKELADATVVTIVPLCLLQFIVQMLTAPYIREELGLASSSSLNRGRGANGVLGFASGAVLLYCCWFCWYLLYFVHLLCNSTL
ncbi:unnamed protein product [Polarella glacialis]|uniref:Uncharacterized protein n=1 Tax=Polarella glacialis TaxID=89957 RepID=A0A813LZC5_POLGL|nr:unnamed protein product [Polarella glacialis]